MPLVQATSESLRTAAPRRERPARRLRLPRARPAPGQPGRAAARLLGRPDRRRGLRAAVPRPRQRHGPGRRDPPHLLRRRLERRLGPLLLHRARRGLPALPGLAARPRHAVRRRRAGAGRAGRALRAERPRHPQRRAGRDLGGEPRHPRGLGGRRPPTAEAAPGRSAAVAPAWSTTPSTCVLPDGTEALLVVTNDGATEFRLARCPVPRDAGPGPTAWEPVRAGGPRRAARARRRVRDPRGAPASARRGSTGCACCRSTTSAAPGSCSTRRFAGGTVSTWAATRTSTRPSSPWSTSPTSSRRCGRDVDLATGERTERHRQRGARPRPADVPLRDPDASRPPTARRCR